MRHEKLIVIMLIVSLFVLVSLAISTVKLDDSQMSVAYKLLVESKVDARAETIDCRLRVENKTEVLQFVFRPVDKDISLDVKGLDKRRYSITFEERGFESLAKIEIPLRPKCAIEMKLAKIVLSKPTEGESRIPQGNYSITASWKRPSLPDVKAGNFEVLEKYLPPPTGLQPSKDEYPLGIILESSSNVYYQGEPIMLNVRLQNNGPLPVKLMNFFDRHKDFFQFEKRYAVSNEKIEQPMHMPVLITPHAIEGWITLLPGECLSTTINASDEFKTPGEYYVTVTYYRSRILLCPPGGKPYYTTQHRWTSNEIDVVISETTIERDLLS